MSLCWSSARNSSEQCGSSSRITLFSLTICGLAPLQRQSHEGVSKILHTDIDGMMADVRATSFRDGVVIGVDDSIEVECDNFGDT